MSGIIWIIVIGFIAGIIARFLSPGPNDPKGFILTTALGIAGAFLATFIGQAVGWYRLDQGAGFIGATVGAVLVLFIWNRLVAHRVCPTPAIPAAPPPLALGIVRTRSRASSTGLLALRQGHTSYPRRGHSGGKHGTARHPQWHAEWPARPTSAQQRR